MACSNKGALSYSPILADKVAADTRDGLGIVAQKLIKAIKGLTYLKILASNEKKEKREDTKSLSQYLLSLLKDGNISLFNKVRYENLRVSVDFHDTDLSNGKFDGADMYGINFRNAYLSGPSLD